MRNLGYFFHYHRGNAREKSIKVVGSALIATLLFLVGGSIEMGTAASRDAALLVQFIPESGYLIAQSEVAPTTSTDTATSVSPQEPTVAPAPVQNLEGTPPPNPEMMPSPEGEGSEFNNEEHERFEAQRALEDQARVLREMLQQKKDLGRLLKQLQRLKGAQDDVTSANTLLAAVVEHESAISGAKETEDIRDALGAYFDAEIWEEIKKIRRKVELPKELNMLLKDLTRVQRLFNQKSSQKLGVDIASLKARVEELLAKHAEAKAAYGQGDFEAAEEALQDFRDNHPGNLTGAMSMLKGISDQLRGVRDKDFTADMEDLLASPIEDINSGEWQSARESLEAIQRELGPVVWRKIIQNQKYRKGIPEDVFEKIERLKDKIGESGHSATEALPVAP